MKIFNISSWIFRILRIWMQWPSLVTMARWHTQACSHTFTGLRFRCFTDNVATTHILSLLVPCCTMRCYNNDYYYYSMRPTRGHTEHNLINGRENTNHKCKLGHNQNTSRNSHYDPKWNNCTSLQKCLEMSSVLLMLNPPPKKQC